MINLENINWTSEIELQLLEDCDDLNYSETDWNITFEYNGIKLFAVLDFSVNLYETGEEETNSLLKEVLDVDVFITQLLDEDDLVFELSTRQEIELTNKLQIDLKTQF